MSLLHQPAPDFSLDATDGRVSLGAYRGKKLILAFFPLAFTPG
ncbi:MAG: redoxin domain-containing protein [Actinomycetia bacterium]|nr:redoxin domain-containing protein [Actinomycetes bacterium]